MKVTVYFFASLFTLSLLLTACNSSDSNSPITPGTTASPSGSGAGLGHTAPTPPPSPSPLPSATPRATATPVASATPVAQGTQPLALIYKGPGSCSLADGDAGQSGYGCSEAAADAATLAGFRFQYVSPTALANNASVAHVTALFGEAKVWIQPGGVSNEAYDAMTSKLRSSIVSFVNTGGGYVGFCAGAYLGADWLNLFPGSAEDYNYKTVNSSVDYGLLSIVWAGVMRTIYFEGGPYLDNLGPTVEVMATFSTDGKVAAARAPYGKGRVYLSGAHPEAPQVWSQEDGNKDADGSDLFIAADMISWAGGQE